MHNWLGMSKLTVKRWLSIHRKLIFQFWLVRQVKAFVVEERVVSIDFPLIYRRWYDIVNCFLLQLGHRSYIITDSLPNRSRWGNKISASSFCAFQERDSLNGLGYLLYLFFQLWLAFFDHIRKNIRLVSRWILPSNFFGGRSGKFIVKLGAGQFFGQISHGFMQFHFVICWVRRGLIGRNGIRSIDLGSIVWAFLFLFVCLQLNIKPDHHFWEVVVNQLGLFQMLKSFQHPKQSVEKHLFIAISAKDRSRPICFHELEQLHFQKFEAFIVLNLITSNLV